MSLLSLPWTQISAVFVLCVVVLVYSRYFLGRKDGGKKWPPSHPWSGGTLLLVAVFFLTNDPEAASAGSTAKAISKVAIILSAVIWLFVSLAPRRANKK